MLKIMLKISISVKNPGADSVTLKISANQNLEHMPVEHRFQISDWPKSLE